MRTRPVKRLPPHISLFLDTTTASADVAARTESRWRTLAGGEHSIEIVSPLRGRARAVRLAAALARAHGAYLAWIDATLDPDVDALHALAASMAGAGAAAPIVRDVCGKVESAGGTLTRAGARVPLLSRPERVTRVLFAPAGAALYDRSALLQARGFFGDFITGHEDADAGWRLALCGRESVVVPSLTFRRAAAACPVDRLTRARHLRHACGNELRTLITCAPDEWLRPALAAAVARHLALAGAAAGIDPAAFRFGASIARKVHLPVETVARLLAIDDVINVMGTLLARREALQALRNTTGASFADLFADPVDAEWVDAAGEGARVLCDALLLGRGGADNRTNGEAAFGSGETRVAHAAKGPPPSLASTVATVQGNTQPSISIVVLTALGPTHLPACLDSIARLNYPRELIEVVIVDNASRDDPTPVVARHYPLARVLRQTRNLGFCGGNAAGFRASRGDWVLFLNDDTRIDPDLLNALVDTARRRGAACVGAFITNWTGDAVDFAGSAINFESRGFQLATGSPDVARWRSERPAAFACGAAMLIERQAFARAGGFPEEYFAYYEDVALGWALWLLGHEVWISKDALVRHLHHGTSSQSAAAARVRHCERNAFYTVFTHTSAEGLPDVLAACLILASERVLMGMGLGGGIEDGVAVESMKHLPLSRRISVQLWWDHFRASIVQRGGKRSLGLIGAFRRVGLSGVAGSLRSVAHLIVVGGGAQGRTRAAAEDYDVPAEQAAVVTALLEWNRTLPALAGRRAALQRGRVRSDAEVVSRFPDNWLDAVPVDPSRQAEYNAMHRAVIEAFRIRRFLDPSVSGSGDRV